MGNVKFTVNEEKEFTLISFEMSDILSPEDLTTITPPEVNGAKGVVLSGRGPIWLYCFLTHFYHPTKFIATYDPRLEGAVIVERHASDYKVGSVIRLTNF
ncbi:CRISPR-associated ring nuclease Crn3/Csx3 [Methanosarcina sp.]|uniref:CRISPR-associated ring nuclease Crn3/Csx3 n=1 Tax=Methanosarcina sp. TaxID=2213 RepID=UPI0029887334|nr:CRISPR-associated ring nuclease Crn3/Csx3 [Methanosarcina sp.]MDW5550419.1 CRISPR-associated ring nuclease Crn3/Csx3 [Methanosarcina sp.]MDW5554743.1 CRISPR-associated ring nuclease Crn3/Csx3 [Methanosarcina sp.]MDW5559958.1 CRISPR-associated ring nuclease Crn3/Csx3 [Methanosarcina sp.]